ncbi:cell division protein FtsL [Jannaschia donghaensis]|uniref:Cell division protein FtsL n=1 Tax=Jannaschia donghaensis TaxID=420998 RepID=A0A0M6YER7_9RHOB|nr:cell division protein FtsL [Jannaschia donghaensis]CTQ48852.1 cell division protein FtsL [Jannaschia donghaensis]
MRSLLYALSIAAVVGLAFWAYGEGYETRQTEREVARLEREIGTRHQELSMLRAEWAYLNRPDRLHELAEMNFESLGLIPLAPDHFALADQVGYPPPAAEIVAVEPAAPLDEAVGDIVIMTHRFGADAEPRLIAPPTLADDGEQLP